MKVLSLFDGMSCGQIALKQLGIISEVYYASEVDKHAIKQTQLNFPNTIQLGDVTQVDVSQLEPIDLLIGGSPCQSFSLPATCWDVHYRQGRDIHSESLFGIKRGRLSVRRRVLSVLGVYAYPNRYTEIQS